MNEEIAMRGVPPVHIIGLSMSPATEPFWQAACEHRLVVQVPADVDYLVEDVLAGQGQPHRSQS